MLTATATPLRAGRSTTVAETELRDGAEALIAETTRTHLVPTGRARLRPGDRPG